MEGSWRLGALHSIAMRGEDSTVQAPQRRASVDIQSVVFQTAVDCAQRSGNGNVNDIPVLRSSC